MAKPQLLFVTGKLAEPALRRLLAELAPQAGFDFAVFVLPISVVALATTRWIADRLQVPDKVERIILPGSCPGDLAVFGARPVERGPEDLRELPEYFGRRGGRPADYGLHDIEILAEINHCPRLSHADILHRARAYRAAGADIIDLGCDPGHFWTDVGEAVRALCDEGMRVSIDSFDSKEVAAAIDAGAELVLSVNQTNVATACAWGCEVVAIPDNPENLAGLDATLQTLDGHNVRFRIDPVLEPIAFGFAASLGRYLEVRRRYPQAEIMMGVGNLTELTGVDSAGINVLLLGFCQEQGIRSVLTTEVINWCRSSVRELDLARRVMHYACHAGVLPKHLEPDLLMLRDPKVAEYGREMLTELAAGVRDRNFRLFAEGGLIHVLNGQMYLQDADPFALFAEMSRRTSIDAAHAFYLGYEMAKAHTALTLGKKYVQDQALRWGLATVAEQSHRGTMPPGGDSTGPKE
jgi:dihydropteroate synthase-like protein